MHRSDDETRAAFRRTALVHLGELVRVAARVVGSREIAEDLFQETYLQAWKSFHRFEEGTNCRAWLYKILFFVVSQHRRKVRRAARRTALSR